jgi:hypothetical protein
MIIPLLVLNLVQLHCGDAHLRGSAEPSPDGKTYLMIVDDNGGEACEDFIVDGKVWPHSLNEKGEIDPGIHTIECGGSIEFAIPRGVIFSFDYWGP